MSLCESPLTLIEETAHGSCRSTTVSGGAFVCRCPSVYMCVCVWRWDMLSSKPVRTSTWPLQPVLCVFFCVLLVRGSHHSAFSRWFPAGLRMTCDNITVLKGQAWREPVGGFGLSLSTPPVQSSTHTLCSVHTLLSNKRSFMNFQTTPYWPPRF